MSTKWHWIEPAETGSVGGETFGKLFKNQGYSPSDLLAREALQNSWDAAIRRDDGVAEDFRFDATFRKLEGEEFQTFSNLLGLDELIQRREEMDSSVKTPDLDLVRTARSGKSISVLYVSDFGTTGLPGHPRLRYQSRLYRAMYTLGSTKKDGSDSGQGGSFGFGKSALISGSLWRVVVAYSQFECGPDDPATSRLVGWTYWPEHEASSTSFEGRAMFGNRTTGSIPTPFENDEADELARHLGFPSRSDKGFDNGTTFMLLGPNLDADGLLNSLERYWWPALADRQMQVSVRDQWGNEHYPKPKRNPSLRPFLRAYELAVGGREPLDPDKEIVPSTKWKRKNGLRHGDLALVIDPEQEPLEAEQDSSIGEWHNPTVALLRRPRMIIDYQNYSSTHPIRGVFVADNDMDELLRSVEPPLHDSWSKLSDESISQEAKDHAESILKKIKKEIKNFSLKFAPVAHLEDNTFSELGQILGDALSGNSTGGVAKPPKPVTVPRTPQCDVQPRGALARKATRNGSVSLSQEFEVTFPSALSQERVNLSVAAKVFVCEDLDSKNGMEVPSELTVASKSSGSGSSLEIKNHPVATPLIFSISVPTVHAHHKLSMAPSVTVRLSEPE